MGKGVLLLRFRLRRAGLKSIPSRTAQRGKSGMSNEFYAPGKQRGPRVHDLFASVAGRYDLLNDIQSLGLHRLWKRRVVNLAQVRTGDRALDVCCGTGDIAIALAQRGADVVGLDFNGAMLEVARTRMRRLPPARTGRNTLPGRGQLDFIKGDAQALPFPQNTFAAVTVGYGLRNLPSWQAGLGEMIRVARPGGRILVLDFGKPPNRLLRSVYFGYLALAVPVLGRLFAGNAEAYSYILESLRHYPAQEGVAAFMRDQGLKNILVHHLLGGMMSINHGVKQTA